METVQGTPIVLQAAPGMKLTQAADVDAENRTVTDRVYLAATDGAANWKEITDAEAEAINAERQRLMQRRLVDMDM